MEKNIYDLLSFIKVNNKIPTCDELNLTSERLNKIIKKCNADGLLDKNIVFVKILGTINSDKDPDLAITTKGLQFLKDYNPLGNLE